MWFRSHTSTYTHIIICLFLLVLLASLASGTACRQQKAEKTEQVTAPAAYDEARGEMVKDQIQARGITDPRVIAAMLKVRRELFVPVEYRQLAYGDMPLPIGEDQTISQPYIVALMTARLDLSGDLKVLEIGTGSGYQAAVLAEIAKEVYTIEIVESLGKRAEDLLRTLGYSNIKVKIGDGYEGWPEYAPFDRIIVTCAPTAIPQPLIDQLADGGLMVIPVGTAESQYLYRVRKHAGKVETEEIIPVRFVPLTGPHAG